MDNSRAFRLFVAPIVVMAMALPVLQGCGSGQSKRVTGKVDGAVTFNDQPVKAGTVYLERKDSGDGSSAPLDSSGKFKVPDPLPVGTYIVVVMPIVLSPDEIADGKQPPPSDDIPEKYRSPSTSGLTFEIKEGQNTLQIKMAP